VKISWKSVKKLGRTGPKTPVRALVSSEHCKAQL